MHNPASFEHVETRYEEKPEFYHVIMKYRGTNGFGAVVTNYAEANTWKDGRLKQLLKP